MILRLHSPAFPLNRFIEHLLYFDGSSATHTLDRFLPDGNTELVINLTERPQHIYDNETLQAVQTCHRAWVSGVRSQPITIPSGRDSRMLIVAFKKGRAFPFYPFPMHELMNTVVEAEDVFGVGFHVLREQLLASKSIQPMFQLVESFLIHRAGETIHDSMPTRCVEYALGSIVCDPGSHCLQQLVNQIGYSQKHFIDLFKQYVGISPKQYLRIARFQRTICAIETTLDPGWSRIAQESGYYDQSHFINEFRCFSGFTPGEYVKRKSSLLNYIPVQ